PGVDGPLARGTRAVLRPGRGRVRVRAPRGAQSALVRQEAAAPEGPRAAAPRGDPGRPQAGLLPADGLLAPRRLTDIRARDAVGRDPPPPGLLPAGSGRADDRGPRHGPAERE